MKINLSKLGHLTVGVRDKYGPEYDEEFVDVPNCEAVLTLIKVTRAAIDAYRALYRDLNHCSVMQNLAEALKEIE